MIRCIALAAPAAGATADPAVRAKMRRAVPLGHTGEGNEVANAILLLASDKACHITGARIYADGGSLTPWRFHINKVMNLGWLDWDATGRGPATP